MNTPIAHICTPITPNGYRVVYNCTSEQYLHFSEQKRGEKDFQAHKEVYHTDWLKQELLKKGYILEIEYLYL